MLVLAQLVALALMLWGPATVSASACQLEGEYRGHVGTKSHLSTRQGTAIATFQPAPDCESGGVTLYLKSRIIGELEPILHTAFGTYTVDETGHVSVSTNDGISWEGLVTSYCGSLGHAVVFMASPNPYLIFDGSMLRSHINVSACLPL